MPQTADVVVIGAGIAGISVAARLARKLRVVVLEAESQPAYHATGRSAAYFAPAYGNDVVRTITAASTAFFESPDPGFTDVPLLKPRAAMFVARHEQSGSLDSMLAGQSTLSRLTGTQINEHHPLLKPEVITGAAFDSDGGDLDVNAIVQGFMRLMRSNGGELVTNAGVQSIDKAGIDWQVTTRDDTITTPIVVNAAGAWADNIAGRAGLPPLGLTPMRRTAFLVDAPPATSISNWPLVIDIDENFYFKPDAGQLLISPADETPSAPCDAFAEELDVAIAADRVQQIATLTITKVNHQWAGLRTFAPDRTFVVGFDPRGEGFFWLAGQGGYGVQTSPGLSDLAGALITGEREVVDASLLQSIAPQVTPRRFC